MSMGSIDNQAGMLKELYQQMILDHGKSPRNFRAIEPCTHQQEAYNPLCGDRINLYVDLHKGEIDDIAFTGQACAICTASASLMTEAVKGKSTQQAETLFKCFHHALSADGVDAQEFDKLGKVGVLRGVKAFPMRIKCATLAWHALNHALHGDESAVTTE